MPILIDVAIPIAPGDYDLYRGGLGTLNAQRCSSPVKTKQGFNGQNEQIWDDFERLVSSGIFYDRRALALQICVILLVASAQMMAVAR